MLSSSDLLVEIYPKRSAKTRSGSRGTYAKRKQSQLFEPTDNDNRILVASRLMAGYACIKQRVSTISFTDKLPLEISVSSVLEAPSRSGSSKVPKPCSSP